MVVAGVGGEPRYTHSFTESATAMADAAARRFGLPDSSIFCLVEKPAPTVSRCAGRSTRENVDAAFASLAARARAGDRVFILLIGHGSGQGADSRFNLPGPDLSAADFERLIRRLGSQKVAFVNAASASGDFVPALSGPNRAIITATKTSFQRNETMFARFFVAAYTGEGADVDKDGRVSLLEAFDYARREVRRAYEQENRLLTENALLDDDGDGKGSAEPQPRGGGGGGADGAMARTMWLSGGGSVASGTPSDPRAATLVAQRDSLEALIEALRGRKSTMDSTAYARDIEHLLVELATKTREIRSLGTARP
ncbi:MAG: C13 family peptidase [Gemmatimonadota bacterium]|nr:C13 family peptidase [Gemmatimonadota bacterium]